MSKPLVSVQRAEYKETEKTIEICLTCLRQRCETRRQLRAFLEKYFRELVAFTEPDESSTKLKQDDLAFHDEDTHETLSLTYQVVQGPASHSKVMPLIEEVDPKLLNPMKHFDGRNPENAEIIETLKGRYAPEFLVRNKNPKSLKYLQGGMPQEDVGLESVYCRVANKRAERWIAYTHTLVLVASGLQPLLTLMLVKAPAVFEHLEVTLGARSRQEQAHLMSVFAWHCFLPYLSLSGEDELVEYIDKRWPEGLPPFEEAIWSFAISTAKLKLLSCDLAVIQFGAVRKVSRWPEIKTYEDLFAKFEELHYPRLSSSDDRDHRQALDRPSER